ncbi:hypothetical protein [Gottfriedia acidiceleris]|uniref:hypothetical protein n=1 Tax=Gottfriedia acidiceleris TaxID=371036 RepID=UPI003000BA32
MDHEDRKFAVNALRLMFIGSQLDGIKFGLSSANTFIYFMHYTNHEPNHLWINIESKWRIYPPNTIVFPTSEEEIEELSEDEQFKFLFELRRDKVLDIRLGDISPHLYISFNSGKILFINGYYERYECWQA